jgi:hypothetical protein
MFQATVVADRTEILPIQFKKTSSLSSKNYWKLFVIIWCVFLELGKGPFVTWRRCSRRWADGYRKRHKTGTEALSMQIWLPSFRQQLAANTKTATAVNRTCVRLAFLQWARSRAMTAREYKHWNQTLEVLWQGTATDITRHRFPSNMYMLT